LAKAVSVGYFVTMQTSQKIGRPPKFKKGAMTAAERARRYRRNFKRKHPNPKTVAKQHRRAEREAALAAATTRAAESLGRKLYGVLYVDPPWDFLVRDRETSMDRHAANHYPVMSLGALAALKLPATKDCTLYLWTTIAHDAHAQWLIEQWGFAYKSQHIWGKPDCGTGFWGLENAENSAGCDARRGPVPGSRHAIALPDHGAARRAQREAGDLRRDDRAALAERAQARNVRAQASQRLGFVGQ
jgi:hypothetical protein